MKTLVKLIGLGLLSALVAVGATRQEGDKTAKSQTKDTSKENKSKAKPVSAEAAEKSDKKDGKSPEEVAAAENELTQSQMRAVDLLKQAGDEAASISDGRSGARMQANAADQLWERDREYSKKLFDSAFDIACKYYRDNKEAAQPQGTRMARVAGPLGRASDARMDVIRLAAKRDSALGRKFTDEYLDEKKRERADQLTSGGPANGMDSLMGNVDPAANDLLSTASALLQTDQKSAIELAQRAFAIGVPSGAPSFLAQLATKDQQSADQLYRFALDRMGGNPQATAAQVLLLAAYPFGDGQVFVTSGQMTMNMVVAPPKGYKVSPPLIQQFLATGLAVIGRATELDTSQADSGPKLASALFAAKTLQPKYAAFQPALLDDLVAITSRLTTATSEQTKQQVDQAAQSIAQTQDANAKANGADSNTNVNNSGLGTGFGPRIGMPGDGTDQVKRMLDQAEKATDPQQKDGLYSQAALAADRIGDTDRAFEISGKISDREFRAQTNSWLSYEAATRLMKDKHFDDAKRYASQIIEVDQYATVLTQMASEALKDKDQPRATELLNDATRKINGSADTQEKLRALLGIAATYSTFDQVRGFEIVGDAVQAANKIKDYDPEKNNTTVRSLGNSAGMNMRMISSSTGGGQDISSTLGTLAKSDFNRALLLAQSLENKALRISSTIAIASSAFEKKKPL